MKTTENGIEYKEQLPGEDEYWYLFQTTGWNENYQFIKEELTKALKQSWHCISVYNNHKLIGFGRVISDGVHHAFIVDLIIHPDFRGQSLGSKVLEKLINKCKASQIRDIQLFSAKNKFKFYEKFGFNKRPDNAPGMQLR